MKLLWLSFWCLQASVQLVSGFAPSSASTGIRFQIPGTTTTTNPRRAAASGQQEDQQQQVSEEERQLYERFQNIAQRLRVSIHSHGFDSKDPNYGIERVCATIPVDPSLGLELTQVAKSTTEQGRGLVLVSKVGGNAAASAVPIEVGDTLVSVGVPGEEGTNNKREEAMGLDYDATMDAIIRAKTQAQLSIMDDDSGTNGASIILEFNRLVQRKAVTVVVDGASSNGKSINVEGKAGDNLLQLLKRHNIDVNAGSSCGGEGICGTCMVQILEGEETLNKAKTKSEREGKRKSCQTVVGADNKEGTIRISL